MDTFDANSAPRRWSVAPPSANGWETTAKTQAPAQAQVEEGPGQSRRPRARNVDGKKGAAALPDFAFVVLGHLERHPEGVHGYELGRALAQAVAGPRFSQIYRLLRRLERAGMASSRVETESSHLRYRFSITASGRSALHGWLTRIPDRGVTCEQLLDRLRFADRLPRECLIRWIDAALSRCDEELGAIEATSSSHPRSGAEDPAYAMAMKARLTADRCWIEELRRRVERSAPE